MFGCLSRNNFYTRNYVVREQERNQADEVILNEDQIFNLLDGQESDMTDIDVLSPTYAQVNVAGGSEYRATGYVKFESMPPLIDAEIYTTSEECRHGPGRGIMTVSTLPDCMNPDKVGRNPLST